jgi:hypothetical protein
VGQRFLSNWHIDAIAYYLEEVRRGAIRRLIITLPPRNLKSICASVAFPAFALGHDPALRIVCASYSQELADKHARDCRAVMGSEWYRRLFPRTDRPAQEYRGGVRDDRAGLPARHLGRRHAHRARRNLIVIDDPMKLNEAMSDVRRKVVKEWYDMTLVSRLDQKTEDAIVIVMQRLHVDDLVGHVLEKDGEIWP